MTVACLLIPMIVILVTIASGAIQGGDAFSKIYVGITIGVVILAAITPTMCALFMLVREAQYVIGIARVQAFKEGSTGQNPILYLRAFALDGSTIKKRFTLFPVIGVIGLMSIRLEEVIARTCFVLSPLVAVGNPNEERPALGAIRDFLSDDAWQPFVEDKIVDSAAIVFVMADGNFTGWEADKIMSHGAISKTVFVVPPDYGKAVQYLKENPKLLNHIGGQSTLEIVESGNCLCLFTKDGECQAILNVSRKDEVSYRLALRKALLDIENSLAS